MVSGTKGMGRPFDGEVSILLSMERKAVQLCTMVLASPVIYILAHVLAAGGTLTLPSTNLTRLITGES